MKMWLPSIAAAALVGVFVMMPGGANAGAVHVPQTIAGNGAVSNGIVNVHSRHHGSQQGAAIVGAIINGIAQHQQHRSYRRHYNSNPYPYGYSSYGYRRGYGHRSYGHRGYGHRGYRYGYGHGYGYGYGGAYGGYSHGAEGSR